MPGYLFIVVRSFTTQCTQTECGEPRRLMAAEISQSFADRSATTLVVSSYLKETL